MKKIAIIGFIFICASTRAMAYGYDYGNAEANWETANISAQEQADVMHELREGDFREAQQVIQQDEAMKYAIRREQAMYNNARAMSQFNYGSYGYSRW
jgi:ribosomal protein L22